MPTLNVPGLVPDERAQVNPVSVPTIPVDANAFGGAVGQAFEGLGRGLTTDADQLWSRAVELQQLQNETEANNHIVASDRDQGIETEKFLANEGLNAGPEAYEAYVKRLEDIRQGYRAKLTNPDVQRRFDAASTRNMAAEIRRGAGHSAGQVRAAHQASAAAIQQGALDQVGRNPEDEVATAQAERHAADAIVSSGRSLGKPDDAINQDLRDNISHFKAKKIASMYRVGKGDEGDALYDEALKKGQITNPDDQAKVDQAERNYRYGTKAVNMGADIFAKNSDKSEAELRVIARKEAHDLHGDDPGFANHVEAQAVLHAREQRQGEDDTRRRALNVIAGLQVAGAKSVQDIQNAPGGAKAWNDVGDRARKTISFEYEKVTNRARYHEIEGMLTGERGPKAQAQAMDLILDKEPLDNDQRQQLVNMRDNILNNPKADMRVGNAMQVLRGPFAQQMRGLNIYEPVKGHERDYDHFTGILHSAIEAMHKATGKPVTDDELINKIAPIVMPQAASRSWTQTLTRDRFGTPDISRHVVTVPPDQEHDIRVTNALKGHPPMTDDDVARHYVRGILKETYGPKESTPTNAKP